MEESEKAQHVDAIFTEVDHEEPYSVFSPALRTFLTYFLGYAMILSTLTATIYFPLIPILSTQLHVSIQSINLTVTVYAIAQALSPAIFASLADSFGRRPVFLCLVTLYAVPSLGLALNRTSYPALITLRALQSIGGSAIPSISYGVVADVAPVAERGSMLGPMLSTCNGISAVGPVIGGAVALGTGGVRWVFLALFLIAVTCLVLAGFTLPETARTVVGNGSVPAVGIWRTWWSVLASKKSQREDVCDEQNPAKKRQAWRAANAFASFRIILYKDAAVVLWMVASSYSVYYTFQVAIPVIFDDIYRYNELQIGLVLLPGLAGMTIGGIIAGKLVDRNYAVTARNHNVEASQKNKGFQPDFPLEVARYRNCFATKAANGVSYSFHLLPSGLVNPNCRNLIGSSPSFFKELEELERKGLSNVHDRIFISDRVHIDLDLHVAVDGLEEVELGDRKVGTTGRGIGPAYSTKAARSGIRLAEVFNEELFESKLRRLASGYKKRYGDLLKYDVEEEIARFKTYRPNLRKYTVDAIAFMKDAQEKNMKILCEGANALMLDLDWGSLVNLVLTWNSIGGMVTGLALDIRKIGEVIGVVKAYTTRVGSGAFKTEDLGEYGYFNWPNTALRLLDVLDTFPTIKIAIAYIDPVTGEKLDSYPASLDVLDRAEVIYHEMPGWNQSTTNVKTFEELPQAAQDYILYIEEFVGVKIKWVGTGPDRDAMITRF
ncbi:hypothetical protein ACSS6W_006507 [Trichoderma asperelloides]